jgi:hypothetical protein
MNAPNNDLSDFIIESTPANLPETQYPDFPGRSSSPKRNRRNRYLPVIVILISSIVAIFTVVVFNGKFRGAQGPGSAALKAITRIQGDIITPLSPPEATMFDQVKSPVWMVRGRAKTRSGTEFYYMALMKDMRPPASELVFSPQQGRYLALLIRIGEEPINPGPDKFKGGMLIRTWSGGRQISGFEGRDTLY